MVTLYSTPTCAPCRAAGKQLDAADVPYEKVDLTTSPAEVLERLKTLLGPVIHTPLFEVDGEFHQLDGLRSIIAAHVRLSDN